MSFITPWQDSFNGGAISPRLKGRVRKDLWGVSVETMIGFLPLLQGPAEAMPGTIHVANAAGDGRLLPFEFNATQGYAIEATFGKYRFYTNDVRIEVAPGVPYEVAHPYTVAQLQSLNYHQAGDFLWQFHRDVQTRKLVRIGATSFTLATDDFRNGPWETRNSDEGITVSASATTGNGVQLTANSPIFALGDVGGLFEIEFDGLGGIKTWEPGITIALGALVQWDGNVYQVSSVVGTNPRTGSVAPIHRMGREWDGLGSGTDINDKGPYGVELEYLFDRFGQAEIVTYVNPTTVLVKIQRRFASANTAQWRWKFGAFSTRRGWPQAGLMYKERLWLFKDNKGYASVVGDLNNFAIRNELGDVSRDMAISFELPDPNPILWCAAKEELQVGTATTEWVIRQDNAAEGFGPGNVKPVSDTDEGGAPIRPAYAAGRTLFVSADRNSVQEFGRSDTREGYAAADLCRYADQMGNDNFAEIIVTQKGPKHIWARMESGELRAALYLPEERALGWADRQMARGLDVRSMTAITDPTGRRTQLWLLVRNGAAHWVLRMADVRKVKDDDNHKVMSDACWVYEGAATRTINAPHLQGQRVEIVADGRLHEDLTLDANGQGQLRFAAERIIAGLPFEAYMKLLPPEMGSDNGTAQYKLKKISKAGVRLLNSDGVLIRVPGMNWIALEQQKGNSLMDTAFPLVTGDMVIDSTMGSYDRDGQMEIRRSVPKPVTVLAALIDLGVGGG